MPTIKRTALAEEDLIDIWLYIAHDDIPAADRLLDDVDQTFSLLADQPRLGPARYCTGPSLLSGTAVSHPVPRDHRRH